MAPRLLLGTTNQPQPKKGQQSAGDAIDDFPGIAVVPLRPGVQKTVASSMFHDKDTAATTPTAPACAHTGKPGVTRVAKALLKKARDLGLVMFVSNPKR